MANSERDGDPEIAGQRADPVAAQNEDLAQAGGPIVGGPSAGEPAKGGDAYAAGGQTGPGVAGPSGNRAPASDVPASNTVAPRVYTSMDDELRETEEQMRKTASP